MFSYQRDESPQSYFHRVLLAQFISALGLLILARSFPDTRAPNRRFIVLHLMRITYGCTVKIISLEVSVLCVRGVACTEM